MTGLNGGGGVSPGYNTNPNLVSLAERREHSEKFDQNIANDPSDKLYIYRERLKQFDLALTRHDEATTALKDSKIVQLCLHILRRLDAIEARLDKLEGA